MNTTSIILSGAAAFSVIFLTACGGSKDPIPAEPDAAVQTIAKELAEGNGGILWQALPASYQLDVNSIAQLAGDKVDPELYDNAFSLLSRLAEVADQQKEFILATELAGPRPAEQVATIEAAWPSIIGFVQTIANSSIASAQGLQAFDGQAFFNTTVSTLIQYSEDLSTVGGEELPLSAYRDVVVKVLESSATTAKLEMTSPDGTVNTEEFAKVENRWVPAEMATGWASDMAEARAKLEAINPEEMAQNKPKIMGVIAMLEGVLTQIEDAETQEQFDQALQGAMMPIMGLMMMQGGMGAPSAPAVPMAPSVP